MLNKELFILGGILLILFSCSDEFDLQNNTLTFEPIYDLPEIECYNRYYALKVDGIPASESGYSISVDVDWMKLTTNKLPSNGMLEFHVDNNRDVKGRNACVTLSSQEGKSGNILIYQKGIGDYDSNDEYDYKKYNSLGMGYSIFDCYQSDESIKDKIIDLSKMKQFDSDTTFQSVQRGFRGESNFKITTSYSLVEMMSKLEDKLSLKVKLGLYKKTINRFKTVTEKNAEVHYCAYARLTKIVGVSSLDRGVLKYIIDQYPNNLPFTDDFMETYNAVCKAQSENRSKLIEQMIYKFGTHLIIEGSLGGMIDYVCTFNSSHKERMVEKMENQCKKVFGKKTTTTTITNEYELTSNIQSEGSCTICGGEESKRIELENSIKGLKKSDALPDEKLQQWFSSIDYSNDSGTDNLAMVDFKFMPIWELFSNEIVKNEIMEQVYKKLQKYDDLPYSEEEMGFNIYKIPLTSKDFNFENSSTSSLVKILYKNKVPIVEICEEYVPMIRNDKRIKVFYPIYEGYTNLDQGLFPGDGEGNRPAYLSFYDGKVEITPLDSLGYNDVLNYAYYSRGNLFSETFGLKGVEISPTDWHVEDETLIIKAPETKNSASYSVLKIGSGYWTRNYMTQNMYFSSEIIKDGILFANIFYDNDWRFENLNKNVYGKTRVDKKSILWYLPLDNDRENLLSYLGHNAKSLFKNQVSGFNAQFEGYFGNYDIVNNKPYGTGNQRRDQGKKCFVVFRDQERTKQWGKALVLTPNYTWETVITSSTYNYYPVRLFRTGYFKHQSLK